MDSVLPWVVCSFILLSFNFYLFYVVRRVSRLNDELLELIEMLSKDNKELIAQLSARLKNAACRNREKVKEFS